MPPTFFVRGIVLFSNIRKDFIKCFSCKRFCGRPHAERTAQRSAGCTKRNTIGSTNSIVFCHRSAAIGWDIKRSGAPTGYRHPHLLVCGIVHSDGVCFVTICLPPCPPAARNCYIAKDIPCCHRRDL